jgi:hypothetical protein
MSDAHEILTAEYEALVEFFPPAPDLGSVGCLETAIGHILRRLGPPSLTEASEIERREAIAAE